MYRSAWKVIRGNEQDPAVNLLFIPPPQLNPVSQQLTAPTPQLILVRYPTTTPRAAMDVPRFLRHGLIHENERLVNHTFSETELLRLYRQGPANRQVPDFQMQPTSVPGSQTIHEPLVVHAPPIEYKPPGVSRPRLAQGAWLECGPSILHRSPQTSVMSRSSAREPFMPIREAFVLRRETYLQDGGIVQPVRRVHSSISGSRIGVAPVQHDAARLQHDQRNHLSPHQIDDFTKNSPEDHNPENSFALSHQLKEFRPRLTGPSPIPQSESVGQEARVQKLLTSFYVAVHQSQLQRTDKRKGQTLKLAVYGHMVELRAMNVRKDQVVFFYHGRGEMQVGNKVRAAITEWETALHDPRNRVVAQCLAQRIMEERERVEGERRERVPAVL